jgi:hypothetical protein
MNKLTAWFKENTLAAALIAVLVLGTLALGTLAYIAWDDYGTATADYSSKAAQLLKLSQQKPFPSEKNLLSLEKTFATEQNGLQLLIKNLQKYEVPPFADIENAKPQDRPQRFQDALRNEVTRIKNLANSTGATLPPGFYLGLEEYENRLPTQEDVHMLSKQLTVLSRMAELLACHKDMILSDFSRVGNDSPAKKEVLKKPLPQSPAKENSPYEVTSGIKLGFRCNQGSFREIVNSVSTSPYFLIIDQLLVQNTATEPPRRDAQPATAPPTPDGSAPVQRLPIVVGRELLNVSMKLKGLEFTQPPEPSPTPATKPVAK